METSFQSQRSRVQVKEQNKMTVTVIGQDESVSRKATCVGCGAVLKYYKNDVKSHTYRDYDGASTDYDIKCANCGKPVSVKEWY
jgi:hypothetical protein